MIKIIGKYWLRANFIIGIMALLTILTLIGGPRLNSVISRILDYFLQALMIIVPLGLVGSAVLMKLEPTENKEGIKVLYSSMGLGLLCLILGYLLTSLSWG